MVGALPAAMAGGLAGIVSGGLAALKGEDAVEAAAEKSKSIQGKINEFLAPRTEAGKAAMGAIGEAVAPVAKGMQASSEFLGQTQEELGEGPFKAAMASLAPEVAIALFPSLAGTRAALKAGRRTQPTAKEKLITQIQEGGTDKDLAKYIVTGGGKLQKDALALESIKQGFEPGVIAALKGSTKLDKQKMRKMVGIMERGKANTLFAVKNRASDVAGDSLLSRVSFVKQVNRRAGSEIDRVARSLKGQQVDSSQAVDGFLNNLDDMGITVGNDLKLQFRGSDIEGLPGPQKALTNIVNRMASGGRGKTPDAHDLHRMKRFIDENVTYGRSAEGLGGRTEHMLKEFRAEIDGVLDNKFPSYDKVNSTYSETINALDALQDVAGKKLDLFGPNANKATGTLLRRLMGNAQSRVNLTDAVDTIDSVAKKYVGSRPKGVLAPDFSDDISMQMLFADELDGVFGPVARTSLAGEFAKGFKKVAEPAAGQRTVAGTVIEAGGAGLEKLRGINEKNAIESIKKLLDSQINQ
jgi:hypothetical protein